MSVRRHGFPLLVPVALLAFGAVLVGAAQAAPKATPTPEEKIRAKMKRIVIPKLEFREATFREVLDFLKKKSVELDPTGTPTRSIVLPLESGKGASHETKAEPDPAPALPPPSPAELDGRANARITVSWTNIPLYEAMLRITSMAGLKFRITSTGIEVVPGTESEGTEPLAGAKGAPRNDDRTEAAGRKQGTTPEPEDKAQRQLERHVIAKCERIIFPKLECQDAPLRDVVDFLKKKSIEYDPSPPGQKGVGLSMRLDATGPDGHPDPATAGGPDTRITISLSNISLNEALHEITSVAGVGLRIGPHGFEIVPKAEVKAILPIREAPKKEALEQRLDQLIISKIEFREASIREAVDSLLREARRLDPKGRGINTTMSLMPAAGAGAGAAGAGVPGIPGLEASVPDGARAPGGALVSPEDQKITVSLAKVPFSEALDIVTGLANLKWFIEGNVVRIVSKDEPEPIRQKEIRIPPELFPKDDEAERRESAEMRALLKADPRRFLADNGLELSKDADVTVSDNGNQLILKDTVSNLKHAEHLLEPPPVVNVPRSRPAKEAGEPAVFKSNRIVLPSVQFANVPLDAALKNLQAAGAAQDSKGSGRERGVTIRFQPRKPYRERLVLDSPDRPKVPGLDAKTDSKAWNTPARDGREISKTDPIPVVNFTGANVSLLDAAKQIAASVKYHAVANGEEIVVSYPVPIDVEATMEFSLPSMVHVERGATPEESGARVLRKLFPDGNSPEPWKVYYISLQRRFIVRAREQKVFDMIDEAIQRASYEDVKGGATGEGAKRKAAR